MKSIMKAGLIVIAILCVCTASSHASTDTISFIKYTPDGDSIQGVDGNTSSWSSDDTMVDLGTNSWSLLGAVANVDAFGGNLTHRGTRGLGVFGGESDEIDTRNTNTERIEITFSKPYFLDYVEVRSLFYEPNQWNPGIEEGNVDLYLNGASFYTEHFVGVEDIRQPTKGIMSATYLNPKLVDKLVFYVPQGQSYSNQSEFAVAKLRMSMTPEPVSSVLFLIGGVGLMVTKKRKGRA
jgi:hypothetical protein